MTGSGKLDMSLDDLIKKARSKPAAAGGAKKAAGQQGAAKKKTAVGNKGGAAGGQKQPQQKAGAKGKLTQMKQVKQAPVQQQKQGLKAKGGIQKAGGGGAPRPGANKVHNQRKCARSYRVLFLVQVEQPPAHCVLLGEINNVIAFLFASRYRVSAAAAPAAAWSKAR